MAAQLWRKAQLIPVFRIPKPLPFLSTVRSPILRNFQGKVMSASAKDVGEGAETESLRDSQTTWSTGTSSSKSNLHQRKLHISNLFDGQVDKWQQERLEGAAFEYFSKYGEIERMDFPHHRFTKLPIGYGFVTFRDDGVVQKILADAVHHQIDGKEVKVAPFSNKQMAVQEKRDLTVVVENILNSTSKHAIEAHFSKYGKVSRVILAQNDPTDENLSSYYVMFSSLTGAKKALEQPVQRIAEQSIDSQVKEFSQTTKMMLKTKKVVVTSVPDKLTVEDLKDYFQQFGEVETVELLINAQIMSALEGCRNVAYVHFASEEAVDEIIQQDSHIIEGSAVKIEKQRDLQPNHHLDKHLKLAVQGVPLTVGTSVIRRYLNTTFNIVPTGVFFDRRQVLSNNESPCVVRLKDQQELERVLEKPKVRFGGLTLHFRRLVWKRNTDMQC